MYGKPNHRRRKVIETTTGQTFESLTEAAKQLNIKQSDIGNVLGGRQKSTKGYRFEYV
jgi:hypothetical protein